MTVDSAIFNNETKIQQRIQKAFEGTFETQSVSYDISFHMTDWLSNVRDLLDIYSDIEQLSDDQIQAFVYKFLAHVPPNLNAAFKLCGFGKVEDVFKVGIFEDE